MTRLLRTLLAAAAIAASAMTLSACAPSDPSIVLGSWGVPDAAGERWLTFEEGGTFNGSDGCNGMFGEYRVSGDRVELSDVGSTLMFCEGVDTWLSTAARGEVVGDELVLFNGDGTEIGTLPRSAS